MLEKYPKLVHNYQYQTLQGGWAPGVDFIYYKPGQEQRAKMVQSILKEKETKEKQGINVYHDYDFHTRFGKALGYSNADIASFIQNLKMQGGIASV